MGVVLLYCPAWSPIVRPSDPVSRPLKQPGLTDMCHHAYPENAKNVHTVLAIGTITK